MFLDQRLRFAVVWVRTDGREFRLYSTQSLNGMDFNEWVLVPCVLVGIDSPKPRTISELSNNGRFQSEKKQLGYDSIQQLGSTQAKITATWV